MFYATELIAYCSTVWRSHVPPSAKLSKKIFSNRFGKPSFNKGVTLSLVQKKSVLQFLVLDSIQSTLYMTELIILTIQYGSTSMHCFLLVRFKFI
jgi:hypothetical protein